MPRKKSNQSKHDSEVKKVALEFKKKGFDVDADIPGFKRPKPIKHYIPDVVAKKGHQKKIVEVETPDSKGTPRDKAQQRTFRSEANKKANTTFRRKIAK